jgi:hypothetical protein
VTLFGVQRVQCCGRVRLEYSSLSQVEAVVVPPLRSAIFQYLELETGQDDMLIMRTMRLLQVRDKECVLLCVYCGRVP